MSQVHFDFLNKNLSLIHTEELENTPIPRVGEVIHFEEHADRGMEWYMVIDVRYTIKDKEVTTLVSAKAVSSDPEKGINDARYDVLTELNWMPEN